MAVISQKTTAFLNSEHLSAAESIMIISYASNEPSYVSNEPLAKVLAKYEPKFENKSHKQTFSF